MGSVCRDGWLAGQVLWSRLREKNKHLGAEDVCRCKKTHLKTPITSDGGVLVESGQHVAGSGEETVDAGSVAIVVRLVRGVSGVAKGEDSGD